MNNLLKMTIIKPINVIKTLNFNHIENVYFRKQNKSSVSYSTKS